MKNVKFLCLSAVLSVFAISCASKTIESNNLEREWMMVSFQNFSKNDLVKAGAKISLTKENEKDKWKGGAKMGCNSIFFSAELQKNNKIEISDAGSTMMACQNMEIETAFLKSISGTKTLKVEGHFLTLTDQQGNEMKFVAADWD